MTYFYEKLGIQKYHTKSCLDVYNIGYNEIEKLCNSSISKI
jgi:hypothetical protein